MYQVQVYLEAILHGEEYYRILWIRSSKESEASKILTNQNILRCEPQNIHIPMVMREQKSWIILGLREE